MSELYQKTLSLSGKAAFLLFPALFCVLFGAMDVYASKTELVSAYASPKTESHDTLVLTQGKADLLDLEGAVSDVMVADPSIVDVTVLQSNRLYLVGSELGNTNLIVLDSEGNTLKRLNVHVRIDYNTLQNAINDLFPAEDIEVTTLNDQILLAGSVSTPAVASRIEDLARRFLGGADATLVNFMDMKAARQVNMRVKIVEVSRTAMRELGVEVNANDPTEGGASIFDNLTPGSFPGGGISDGIFGTNDVALQALGSGGITETASGIFRFLRNTNIPGIGTIEVLLQAMEEHNMVNTLAEPNLSTLSGEQASFLVGGEFPVPAGIDDSGNTTFSYRPFGVTLSFRPTIMNNDRINLQLETEISDRDDSEDAAIGDTDLPAFSVRRATTNVEIGSGGSLMIAGLIDSRAVDNMRGLPGIMKTPIIGDLMKSKGFTRNETEVLVIVTAHLVEPFANDTPAEKIPKEKTDPLAMAFAASVRRLYGERADKVLAQHNERYGYLLD